MYRRRMKLTLLTSIQLSSPRSSSRDLLLPLTCCRLLGGPRSSPLGLFLSSILTVGEGGRSAEGEVATGMRKRQSGCVGGWERKAAMRGEVAIKRREFCLRLAWALSMHHELVMPVVLALCWSSNNGWVSTGGVWKLATLLREKEMGEFSQQRLQRAADSAVFPRSQVPKSEPGESECTLKF